MLYLQLLVQRSVRLQPELRAAVLMPDELRSSGCVQRKAIQPLARTVPQQLGLDQPPHHRVVLQEGTNGLTLSGRIERFFFFFFGLIRHVEGLANVLLPVGPVPHTPAWFCPCCRQTDTCPLGLHRHTRLSAPAEPHISG